MKKTKSLVAAVVCGSALSLSGADLEVSGNKKIGVDTKTSIGGIRISGQPNRGPAFSQDGVQVTAEIKAPVRQVEGLKVGLKVQDDSALNEDSQLNGTHKIVVTPSLEMKVDNVTVSGGTAVIRKTALKSGGDTPERLYTDYLRPQVGLNYGLTSQVSTGMNFKFAVDQDPDNAFYASSSMKKELRPFANEDNEVAAKLNYRDALVGLGLELGYKFGKKTKLEEAAQAYSTRLSGTLKASDRVGLMGDVAASTNHEILEAELSATENLLYSGSLGVNYKATQNIEVGARAEASYQKNAAGDVKMTQIVGLSTAVAI